MPYGLFRASHFQNRRKHSQSALTILYTQGHTYVKWIKMSKKTLQIVLILYIINNRKVIWNIEERRNTFFSEFISKYCPVCLRLIIQLSATFHTEENHISFRTSFTHYNQFLFYTQVNLLTDCSRRRKPCSGPEPYRYIHPVMNMGKTGI